MSLLFHICLYVFLFMLALVVYCVFWAIGYRREQRKQRQKMQQIISLLTEAVQFRLKQRSKRETHNWKDEGF